MYEETYELDNHMVIVLKLDKGKLMAEAGGRITPLVARSETEFIVQGADIRIVFNNATEGRVNQFTLHQGGQTFIVPRVTHFDASSLDLGTFTGTYYSPELQTSYTMKVQNNTLVANHIRHEPATLTPVRKDVFSTNTWYMTRIEFMRDTKNEITGLKVSSGRVKNVRFIKRP